MLLTLKLLIFNICFKNLYLHLKSFLIFCCPFSAIMKFAQYDFSHQVHSMMDWCEAWTPCERTVAVYTLFRKMDAVQIKFLIQLLNQFSSELGGAIQTKEEQANNAGTVSKGELYCSNRITARSCITRANCFVKSTHHAQVLFYL